MLCWSHSTQSSLIILELPCKPREAMIIRNIVLYMLLSLTNICIAFIYMDCALLVNGNVPRVWGQ
jgi:hypothetical protein